MSIISEPEDKAFRFRVPTQYNWNPKEDITTYELALCAPVLMYSVAYGVLAVNSYILSLPENARRHFEEVK